jgi:ATP synthase protein I
MADAPRDPFEREDARERARRDVERRRRREPAERFWHSVALVGSVGWPIVLLATGGALLGRYVDGRWDTGVRFTLMLLSLGTGLGTWMALRSVRGAP